MEYGLSGRRHRIKHFHTEYQLQRIQRWNQTERIFLLFLSTHPANDPKDEIVLQTIVIGKQSNYPFKKNNTKKT